MTSSMVFIDAVTRFTKGDESVSITLAHACALASAHGFTFPASVAPPRSILPITECKLRIIDTANKYAQAPSLATARAFSQSLRFLSAAMLRAVDSRPAKLLPATATPEPAPAPRVRYVPHDALLWSTSPSIGVNPSLIVDALQRFKRYLDERKRIAKLAKPVSAPLACTPHVRTRPILHLPKRALA